MDGPMKDAVKLPDIEMEDNSDIARVARLRGRDPRNYQGDTVSAETLMRKINPQQVRGVFFAPQDAMLDIKVYDALPMASRVFIREAPVNISAIKYSDLLEEAVDQAALISLLSQIIPLRVQEVVRQRYGAGHPQA
jgi:hypothetical protein